MKKGKKANELKALDRQLEHWAKTDKQHRQNVAVLEEKHKHDMDWFDLDAYQNMIYGRKR